MANALARSRAASPIGPAATLRPVTPSDTVDLPDGPTRSLFVSHGGTLTVRDASGAVVTLQSSSSQYHPLSVVRVLATNTTASGVVALY